MSSTSVIGKLRVNLGLDSREFDRGIRGVGPNVARMRNQFLAVALVQPIAQLRPSRSLNPAPVTFNV